jgi:hypothetical protein
VYFGSDGEALSVAAEVTDDRHFNAKTGESIAGGDALQIGLVTAKGLDWNIVLALTQAGVALHQSSGEGDTLMKTAGNSPGGMTYLLKHRNGWLAFCEGASEVLPPRNTL